MTSDENIIQALMDGLDLEVHREQGEVDIEAGINQTGVKIETTEGGEFLGEVVGNQTYNTAYVNSPLELQAQGYVRLEELLKEIENPDDNKSAIENKISWFEDHIPIVASVLTVTQVVTELGISA